MASSCSVTQSCLTLCDPMDHSTPTSLSLTISRSLPQLHVHASVIHPAVSFSDVLFSCPQSFPASGTFPVSHLFASAGASASVLPVNTPVNNPEYQTLRLVWFPCYPRDFQESSPAPQLESINSLALFMVQLSQMYVTTEKTIALTIGTFVGRVTSLLFNTLSRFVIIFLPRNNCLWFHDCSHCLQWFLEPKKRISVSTSTTLPPSICRAVMGICHDLRFFFF